MPVEREIFIKGTPYDFASFIRAFEADHQDEWEDGFWFHIRSIHPRRREGPGGHSFSDLGPYPGDNPIYIDFAIRDKKGRAEIGVHGMPDGRTRLLLYLPEEFKSRLLDLWEVLVEDIQRLDMLYSNQQAEKDPLLEIPDIGWQRHAIKLWNEGKTAKEVAAIVGKAEQTVGEVVTTAYKRGPNEDTFEKINALVAIRDDAIKNGREIPNWISACHQAAIDPRTAKKYIGDLRGKWKIKEYRWGGISE